MQMRLEPQVFFVLFETPVCFASVREEACREVEHHGEESCQESR